MKYSYSITLHNLSKVEVAYLLIIIFFIFIFLIQGIVYPPNNSDSMVYHMARIPHWINNNSVAHFPTSIYTQLFQPPFAEYFITHTIILQKSDIFANSIQLLFLIFSLITLSLITQKLGYSRKLQILTVLLALTIPEVVLQASSTQNDIVVSFLIICVIYFILTIDNTNKVYNFIFIGISVGLAFLTKGTAYIFLFPPLVFLIAISFHQILYKKRLNIIIYGIITLSIIFTLNVGHYTRNYNLSNNLLGTHEAMENQYKIERIDFPTLGSNIVKNVGLHLRVYPISIFSEYFLEEYHKFFRQDRNDVKHTVGNSTVLSLFSRPNHEDYAPNIFHALLVIISPFLVIILLIKNKISNKKHVIILGVILLFQFLFFVGYLKWQIFHSRLHTPLFLISIPILSIIIKYINGKIRSILITCIVSYAIIIMIFNATRPIITIQPLTYDINIFDDRELKYFPNNPTYYSEYINIKNKISNSSNKNIGLIVRPNFWEYPFFNSFHQDGFKPNHLLLYNNYPKFLNKLENNIDIQFIISAFNKDTINYNKFVYKNQNIENNHAFLFEKIY